MTAWTRTEFAYYNIIPTSLVGCASRKATLSTTPARDVGISLFTTAPVGRASLDSKNYQAQTDGHLAPGCEDELSGLDPANLAAFSFNEGHTETKGYSGGIGLCLLAVKPTMKVPIGSDTSHDLRLINYARIGQTLASLVRSSRRRVVGIATSMGGIDDLQRRAMPEGS